MFKPRTRHTENVRTRDDVRAQLAQHLVFARSLDGVTPETLPGWTRKLPAKEVAQALAAEQARRAARG